MTNSKLFLRVIIVCFAIAIAIAFIYIAFVGQKDVTVKNGIYITDDFFFTDITANDEVIEKNIKDIKNFSGTSKNIALSIVPTSVAIKQEEIPEALSPYNQRKLINYAYSSLYQNLRTVDVYPLLFSQRNEYTYYYTSDHLTGLGGYYLYSQIASKIGLKAREINNFEIETIDNNYYGELYTLTGYRPKKADLLNIYRYIGSDREYKMVHKKGDVSRIYYELYPTYFVDLNQKENVVFGGKSDYLDITIKSPYETSLLIFSDDTYLSYLTFLLTHYGHITVVDTENIKATDLRDIDISSYTHILFTYSAKTFAEQDLSVDRLRK